MCATKVRNAVIACVLLFSVILSFVGPLALIECMQFRRFMAGRTKHTVDGQSVPQMFPVAVVSQDHNGRYSCAIVTQVYLADYTRGLQHYTFTVPIGLVNRMDAVTQGSYRGNVEIQAVRDGKQYIRVIYLWHGGMNYYAGWYTASAESFAPKYQAFYSIGGNALAMAPSVFVMNVLLWGAVTYAWRRKRRRPNPD